MLKSKYSKITLELEGSIISIVLVIVASVLAYIVIATGLCANQ